MMISNMSVASKFIAQMCAKDVICNFYILHAEETEEWGLSTMKYN